MCPEQHIVWQIDVVNKDDRITFHIKFITVLNCTIRFDNIFLCRVSGNASQPIWIENPSCSGQTCIADCSRSCPTTYVGSCTHSQDVTVYCGKF